MVEVCGTGQAVQSSTVSSWWLHEVGRGSASVRAPSQTLGSSREHKTQTSSRTRVSLRVGFVTSCRQRQQNIFQRPSYPETLPGSAGRWQAHPHTPPQGPGCRLNGLVGWMLCWLLVSRLLGPTGTARACMQWCKRAPIQSCTTTVYYNRVDAWWVGARGGAATHPATHPGQRGS